MLAQLADLRFCALMSLRPYVPVPLCPATFCLRPYVVDRYRPTITINEFCSFSHTIGHTYDWL